MNDDEKESSGWRSISRKFVHNCWPELMESGAVCLLWLSGCPEQVPPLGTGREERGEKNGSEEGKVKINLN